MARRDRGERTDDLIDAARVKELRVQRKRVAVIAEVEPEDAEPGLVQETAHRYDVIRRGAALPAMQQNDEALGVCRLRTEVTEQTNSGPAIDDFVAGRGQEAYRTASQPALPPRPAGEKGLYVAVAQTSRRVELFNGVRQTRPRTRLAVTCRSEGAGMVARYQ
jgi:hypothetical protein